MNSLRQALLGYAVAGLLGLIVGYFVGREHLKYEMRSAFQSAAEGIQKGFGSALGMKSTSDTSRVDGRIPPPKPKQDEPVSVILLKKGYRDHDYQTGIYQDAITFEIAIKNWTGKDIRAFEGVLTFADLLDNTIFSLGLAINDQINAGATVSFSRELNYNQFMASHVRLRTEDQANLKVIFTTRKVLFTDGSIREYPQ